MADAQSRTKTLYLIDGHAQFFRAYYAIRGGMRSPVTGEPTHMTFGFVGMLLKLLRENQPDYLAVVIDAAGDRETFRSELYPQYKANREPPPDDFRPQVQRCLSLLEAMHIPVIAEEGVEADDTIAALIKRLRREHPDVDIRIVSRDKDLTQLLGEGVEMFDPNRDEPVTPADIFKTEGVKPEHVVDILTLMGDTVDNIPGVPGIGPKTAAKLILQYGSVDNLLAHLDEIKGKRRENIEAAKEQLAISRQLVILKDDLEPMFDLEEATADPSRMNAAELLAAFRELGFNQHRDALQAITGIDDEAAAEAERAAASSSGGDEFADGLFAGDSGASAAAPTRPSRSAEYKAITTKKDLNALMKRIRAAGEFAVDTETDSLSPVEAHLCGVSIALEPGDAVYIPTRSPEPKTHLDTDTVLDRLRPVLEDESTTKIAHNLKYDLNVLRHHGVRIRGPMFDTMVASYVIDATRASHKMDALALALLHHTCIPITDLIGRGKKQVTFDRVPLEQAAPYAAEDADITLQLRNHFAPQIRAMGLQDLFDDVEMPLVEVLAELEYNGIRVDPDELERQRAKLNERIEQLRMHISDAAPHPFNPDSPRQLAGALFNKPDAEPPGLGLKVLKRGKTGPSTDQEVLEKLADDPGIDSPVPNLILEYRRLTKLVNTYLVALKEYINPDTGRVHASFNQTVTATGRLSSSDPNLQNIPIRTDVGREIRRAFMAEPGNVLITADYSQIELRLLAHLSDDPALIAAFRAGMDIHRAVAAEVFGVEPDDVTPEQRGTAKMVNFGIVYGITPFGLARRLGGDISNEEARRIIDEYKDRYRGINAFLARCVEDAKEHGFVETILKRRRMIPEVEAKHPQQRALGERMAINTVVQGSAADLIKLAMIDLHRRLPDAHPEARMLLQIHDELVFEAPEGEGEAVEAFVAGRMEAAMDLNVPLVVDTARSTSWIDAK
ncbi:MAG: DNA polymerase I [Planctomycetota bacterium]|nr:DNA polymerase I [Planctomycetota bacterium]